jgi:transposase
VPPLEGKVDHVIEVDTHRDRHAAAILDRNGGVVAELEIESDQAGCEQLLRLAIVRAPGRRCWALEGTGCYGAGLASFLGLPGRVGGRGRPAQAPAGADWRQERPAGRHPRRPGGLEP